MRLCLHPSPRTPKASSRKSSGFLSSGTRSTASSTIGMANACALDGQGVAARVDAAVDGQRRSFGDRQRDVGVEGDADIYCVRGAYGHFPAPRGCRVRRRRHSRNQPDHHRQREHEAQQPTPRYGRSRPWGPHPPRTNLPYRPPSRRVAPNYQSPATPGSQPSVGEVPRIRRGSKEQHGRL